MQELRPPRPSPTLRPRLHTMDRRCRFPIGRAFSAAGSAASARLISWSAGLADDPSPGPRIRILGIPWGFLAARNVPLCPSYNTELIQNFAAHRPSGYVIQDQRVVVEQDNISP